MRKQRSLGLRTFVQGVQGGVRNVNLFCDQIKGKEHLRKCWRSGEGTYKTAEMNNGVHVHEHRRSKWGIRTQGTVLRQQQKSGKSIGKNTQSQESTKSIR